MWLLVGLGNPGRKYERNRHNLGFMVIEELERRHSLGGFREKFGGRSASGMLSIAGRRHKALLLEPMEFMNLSGYAVQRATHFHDIEPDHVIVIHDEIDIDLGRVKLKAGGGHGGHNGLRSIIDQLGSRDFLRVRGGVGRPGKNATASKDATTSVSGKPQGQAAASRDRRVAGYLLSDFPTAIASEVEDLIGRAADATEAIIDRGIRAAMNDIHAASPTSLPDTLRA